MADADVTTPLYGVWTRVKKTASAVHAALDAERRALFEAEFGAALAHADNRSDLDAVQDVVERWWPAAVLCANSEIQEEIDADPRREAEGDAAEADDSVAGGVTSYPHAFAGDADSPAHGAMGDLRRGAT